jgi:hypothetical protein
MNKYYACGNCGHVFVSYNELTEHFTNAECSSVKCELLNEGDRKKKIRENVNRLFFKSLIEDNPEILKSEKEFMKRLTENDYKDDTIFLEELLKEANRLQMNGGRKKFAITNLEKRLNPKKNGNKKAIENEDTIINSINNNENILPDYFWEETKLNPLNNHAKKPTKKNGVNILHTSEWNQLKNGTKETKNTPKTDMQILDDTKKVNISIKSGKGRFTSADCYETSAIFKSVYDNKYQDDEEIKSIIDNLIMLMKNLGKRVPILKTRTVTSIRNEIKQNPDISDEDIEWVKKLQTTEEKCNDLWLQLKTYHEEYVKDIFFECVSGKYKFGDNDGRADWLLVTEKSSSVKCKEIFKLDKRSTKLDSYLMEETKSPNAFKVKTGGTGKQMWIRFL